MILLCIVQTYQVYFMSLIVGLNVVFLVFDGLNKADLLPFL